MLRWKIGGARCRDGHWDRFQLRLGNQLELLRQTPGRFIIVSSRNPHRFVQFASLKGGAVKGEAIGNYFLATAEKLGAIACRSLRAMGWKRPNVSGPGGGNFWRRWASGTPSNEISKVAVCTLQEAFEIASPTKLEVETNEFAVSDGITTGSAVVAPISLRNGQLVCNGESGREYVVGPTIGAGGYGVVFRTTQISGSPLDSEELCLKVSGDVLSWHCEAYFGNLLQVESRVVRVFDSFAWIPRSKDRRPRYCLITEYLKNGDLRKYLENHAAISERKARSEMVALLRTLRQLHAAGVVHRDLTPYNVLVDSRGALKIADFGIAAQSLRRRGAKFDIFNAHFAPPVYDRWLASDDVFHCGQIYAYMLAGQADTPFDTEGVRKLKCSPEAKAIIQRCIGARRKRFASAAEMLSALESLDKAPVRKSGVRSLDGKRVVFTGRMRVVRDQAVLSLKKAGGIPQGKVGGQTDILVVGQGSSPKYKAVEMGQKLLDLQREREAGHEVVELSEGQFWRLCGETIV